MTVKINADTTSGLQLESDTSGAIDFQSNGTTVASLDSSGNFSHNGIEVDMWRMTSNITTNNATVGSASTVERCDDASFSKIGTGMTHSSGIFTFPRTGVYKISTQGYWQSAAADTAVMQTEVSTDNFSTSDVIAWNVGGDLDNAKGTFTSLALFNCTNTSTHKVRFYVISLTTGTTLEGDTNINKTAFCFERLGDSQ
jgi:hypothetical protein